MMESQGQNRLAQTLFGNPEMTRLDVLEIKDLQIFFDIGDRVVFHHGKRCRTGIVDKLNPRTACILGDGAGTWRVNYVSLNHLDESIETSRHWRVSSLWAVTQRAYELMNQYGLSGWRFRFVSTRRRLGVCDYKNRLIGVSLRHAIFGRRAEVTDTILHEIAHVMAGPAAGHGPLWKQIAVRLNAVPKACAPESARAVREAARSRTQYQTGDAVSFIVKGTVYTGRIVRMNPRRAKIETHDLQLWNVDYRRLSHIVQSCRQVTHSEDSHSQTNDGSSISGFDCSV